MAVIAGRNVNNNDLGVMGGGIAVFVFSLFPWFGVKGLPGAGGNGWNVGSLAVLGVLLSLAAAVLVGLRVFANITLPRLQVGWNFIVFAAAGVGALFILLKLLFGYDTIIGSLDRRAGIYLALLGALVESAFAYLAFKVSGETLPGGRRI